MANHWTEEEDEQICKYWGKGGIMVLEALLNGRSRASIYTRASRLGIRGRLWTLSEDRVIRTCYKSEGASYCMRYMPHRSICAIQSRARVIGVKRDNRLKRMKQISGNTQGSDLMLAHTLLRKKW